MAPFGDDDIASSITLTGQAVIKQSNKILRAYIDDIDPPTDTSKDPVIYNDTDSSYISIQRLMDHNNCEFSKAGVVTPEAYKQAEEIEAHLNVEILKWGDSELNSKDCRFVFKRECKKFKYTGVEVVRSTMPKAIKPRVKRIIETMMDTRNFATTNEMFLDTYKEFKKLPIEDMAFVMGIREYDKYAKLCNGYSVGKGTPIHVKAAYYYNLLINKLDISNQFEEITNGDKVRYYYVSTPNKLGINTLGYKQYLPEELRDEFTPNIELMFEKIVYSIIDRFYVAVGWRLSKPSKQRQTDIFELLGI